MEIYVLFFSIAVLCNCNATPSGEQVKRAFSDNQIGKDCNVTAPEKFVAVTYPNDVSVNLGNDLAPTQVKSKPMLSWNAKDNNELYTLIFFDPDAPSRQNPTSREYRHWLVVNIPGSSIDEGNEVLTYMGPAPPKGTGPHRYIFLIYKQSNGSPFSPHQLNKLRASLAIRAKTSTAKFAQEYHLGDPVFGNFFQSENILQKF